MDAARRIVAMLVVVALPTALAYWLLVHPLARHWRRLGPWRTALVVGSAVALIALALFHFRRTLLGADLGFSAPLTGLAVLFLAGALAIGVRVWKRMPLGALLGRPEFDSGEHPGKLVTAGIYGRIRHPRYVEVALGILASALFANYLGLYIVCAACAPFLYLVVVLEERELVRRFGPAYEEYARNVPRFFPKLKPNSSGE